MKIAILQSNYIPWKGYFDLINYVDIFVIYDVVQYTKNDWRNRNIIKSRNGNLWLTIPVLNSSLHQKINETKIANTNWNIKHWKSIKENYSKARYFNEYFDSFKDLYLSCNHNYLSDINKRFLFGILKMLEVRTEIIDNLDFVDLKDRNLNLINICTKYNASTYVSGPAAKSYLDESLFREYSITVEWFSYTDYPEYMQLFPPFEHKVSIIDLIFNTGPDFNKYMKLFL